MKKTENYRNQKKKYCRNKVRGFAPKKSLEILLSLLILVASTNFTFAASGESLETPPRDEDMQGIWVATVVNLDYPKAPTSDERQLQSQLDSIVENAHQSGFNAIFFQVRPTADAFYPSEIFPWSKYLTGKQGTAPGGNFDPLAYLLEIAHAKEIQVHAWINPYRITKGGDADFEGITPYHPAKLHPEYVIKHTDGNYYFDPGLPEVQNLVVEGVLEIMEHYDIDGIHMDDYFYPDKDFPDQTTFESYGNGFSNIEDWRRDNVNQLVQRLDTVIHQKNPEMVFGISPTGIWANKDSLAAGSNTNGQQSYFHVYADTRKWVKEEWVDYIAPQIYWNIGYEIADYQTLVDWWSQTVHGTDVNLYIGMAAYKAGDPDPASPWFGTAEILRQLRLNDKKTSISGEILFRYGSLSDVSDLGKAVSNYYNGEENNGIPSEPSALTQELQEWSLKSICLLYLAAQFL